MVAEGRRATIVRLLNEVGIVRSADLVARLGVSEITVRRDLADLERDGTLRRIHGGAVAAGSSASTPRQSTRSIGVVLPTLRSYYDEVLRTIEESCAARRIRPVLAISDYDAEVERTVVKRLLAHGVDGLLIATALGDEYAEQLGSVIDDVPVPLVMMERSFRTPHLRREVPWVRTDHAYGARLAVRHLAALGHRRIALASQDSPTAQWLHRGFLAETEALGVATPITVPQLPSASDNVRIREAVSDLVHAVQQHGVTGLLIHNDAQAIRFLEIAQASGVDVPGDLALIAYDDVTAGLPEVALTTISPPKRRIGLEACRMLFAMLENRDESEPVPHLELLPQLVVRASCGASRRGATDESLRRAAPAPRR